MVDPSIELKQLLLLTEKTHSKILRATKPVKMVDPSIELKQLLLLTENAFKDTERTKSMKRTVASVNYRH